MNVVRRGFERSEFEYRVARAQALMADCDLGALLLTTHPDIYYFTGYLTRFWESPTRPWYLIVPASGSPVAVIPSIGAPLMETTWIDDIRTWVSPDLLDDGVTLLADTLKEMVGAGKVGFPDGHETSLRMPIADFNRLKAIPGTPELVGDEGIVRALRIKKSQAEIAKISNACQIAAMAFKRVPEFAHCGVPLEAVFRRFQMACLEEGADWVPYLAGGAGPFGYSDVISPATSVPLEKGDVLMLDTGLVHDGYFCDYDRNFVVGTASQETHKAHAQLIEATQAGFEAARPGSTASDVFQAMNAILTGGTGGTDNGRLGHGLGIQLTEWPSLIPSDHTVLEVGMVLTLEPGIGTREGNMLVHEENIVVTEHGARYLSIPQDTEMEIVEA